jgi:CRP-like cAMP-binding protein
MSKKACARFRNRVGLICDSAGENVSGHVAAHPSRQLSTGGNDRSKIQVIPLLRDKLTPPRPGGANDGCQEQQTHEWSFAKPLACRHAGERFLIERVFFPQTGMISLLVITEEGAGVEAATIGFEGAVGVNGGLGKRRAFTRGVIQLPGTISHMPAPAFERVVSKSNAVRDIVARYTEVLWNEAQQIAACNALHDAESRLARWLLQTQDRVPGSGSSLALTQDFLSQMLGIRRTTVTLVARSLQKAGLIRYTRGKITILDRRGLEEAACECYRKIQHETLPAIVGIDLDSR